MHCQLVLMSQEKESQPCRARWREQEEKNVGVETQQTVPRSSLALEEFNLFLKYSSYQQPFILNACPAWAQGLGGGRGTSMHPQLAQWNMDGTFLSAHRSGEMKGSSLPYMKS